MTKRRHRDPITDAPTVEDIGRRLRFADLDTLDLADPDTLPGVVVEPPDHPDKGRVRLALGVDGLALLDRPRLAAGARRLREGAPLS